MLLSKPWGAVVLMENTLERLGLTPSHEEWRPPQGDPTKQLLYQGAEIKPVERKPEELLCTESKKWSAGLWVRSPWTTKFLGHSLPQNLTIMMKFGVSYAYSVLVESN